MIIRIEKRKSPYAIIDQTGLNERALSWKAKGILAYLLGKPDNWKPTIKDLVKSSKDSVDSVESGLKELEIAGYLVRRRIKGPKGHFTWEHTIYETPQLKPYVENPLMDNPRVEKPYMENPGSYINNDLIINDLTSNELKEKDIALFGSGDEDTSGSKDNDDKEYSAEFASFWQCYPRKREKRKAWRAWLKCLKDKHKPGDMIRASQNYAIDQKGSDPKFIKLPATFLGPDKPFLDYLGDGPPEPPPGSDDEEMCRRIVQAYDGGNSADANRHLLS